jgi:hypothetical protein
MAVPPQIANPAVSEVTSSSATLEADINPQGQVTHFHFAYGSADCTANPCTNIPVPDGELAADSSPVRVKVTVSGLSAATVYHLMIEATNGDGTTKSLDRVFATFSSPLVGLPSGRAYEQASPIDKNEGDAAGDLPIVKAASQGSGISFGSNFGIPGGVGAQALPTYLATRNVDGWSTAGLLPPASFGERAQVLGWLADFSQTFANATKLGDPRTKALVRQSTVDGSVTVIAPYTAKAEYSYSGASADASSIFFESQAQLPPKAEQPPIAASLEGVSNLYLWSEASGELKLAGAFNDGTVPPRGSFAGPYDWGNGATPKSLREGGATRNHYLQDAHAITSDGSVYFTAGGTGQLYLRQNPTAAQGAADCSEVGKACTIHVSASEKTNGQGSGGIDPAGAQPAAFQAASVDGSQAFFTSSEMLTNDANTGPEQSAPALGIGNASTGSVEDAEFIPERAVGVAVDAGHVYWADPVAGTIGRADLDGGNRDDAFIAPGSGECETRVETGPDVFAFETASAPSAPRYLAVDAGHIYWTNTGRRETNGDPADGGGTIGRASIDGEAASVDPDFICGESQAQPGNKRISNPQGIAVNASHIYWANAAKDPAMRSVARATITGDEIEGEFVKTNVLVPFGVGLSSTHLYFSGNEGASNGYIFRVPAEGGAEEGLFIGEAGIRGVTLDASYIYWATQGEKAIGRADLDLTPASRIKKFVEPEGNLSGLAVDAAHLYWSINGEAADNPGNDLYRFNANAPESERLTDLTPLASGNGAEVQGVVAASTDGSYLYFTANGVLDEGEEAAPGECHTTPPHGRLATTSGSCSLYLLHEGSTSLVARLDGGGEESADALNWAPSPRELFSTSSYLPKTSFISADGKTLLFRSQVRLTAYDNEGVPEFYRFRAGDPEGIRCVTCSPGGEKVGSGPSLGSTKFPSIGPPGSIAGTASRNLSADGNHVFFETAEKLSSNDTNGEAGCPIASSSTQNFPACLDVYEWVADGVGACQKGSSAYSPLNAGCLYLISTGKSEFPSLFADASASGDDVFFFTREPLVGQDKDKLQDVYDARVGGGLASQNPRPTNPCVGVESCRTPSSPSPAETSPATPNFIGPTNQKQKHKPQKAKRHKAKKRKHKGKGKKHGRAKSKGKAGR